MIASELSTPIRLNLMIMGEKRHGKDTLCEYLRDTYGVTFGSSSKTACDLFLFEKIKKLLGYQTPEEAFNDRDNHRQLWYEEIKAYNEANGLDALGKVIYSNHQIYCGIRDKDEFMALKNGGLIDLTIWIDASERLPPESSNSMKLSKEDADIIISNNGNKAEFLNKIDKFYRAVLKKN